MELAGSEKAELAFSNRESQISNLIFQMCIPNLASAENSRHVEFRIPPPVSWLLSPDSWVLTADTMAPNLPHV
jgi:hypothetical protein